MGGVRGGGKFLVAWLTRVWTPCSLTRLLDLREVIREVPEALGSVPRP